MAELVSGGCYNLLVLITAVMDKRVTLLISILIYIFCIYWHLCSAWLVQLCESRAQSTYKFKPVELDLP